MPPMHAASPPCFTFSLYSTEAVQGERAIIVFAPPARNTSRAIETGARGERWARQQGSVMPSPPGAQGIRPASERSSFGFHFHPRKLVRGQDPSGRTLSPSSDAADRPANVCKGAQERPPAYRPAILAPCLKNGSVLLLHPGQPATSGGRWAVLSLSAGKQRGPAGPLLPETTNFLFAALSRRRPLPRCARRPTAGRGRCEAARINAKCPHC